MNEKLVRYWRGATQYWNKFNRTQQIMIISIVAVLILTIGLVSYNLSKTEYSLAFKNLDQTDAAAIKTYLDDRGIPYQFTADMTAVGVPTSKVTEVKAGVASENLVHSGSIGFGVFTQNMGSFGMTDNQFDVLKVDALGGEIEKLLYENRGVVKATALVQLPEKSPFINTEKEQQAGVAIQLRFEPGYRPSQKQIDAMYNTVLRTLPNLPMENIVISDPEGQLIPSMQGGSEEDLVASSFEQQMKIKQQVEADIRNNVEDLLGTLMGRDSVAASVFASLNFDKRNSTEQLVTPVNTVDSKGIEISVQEIQKSFSSTGGASGGVPGTGNEEIPNYTSTDNSSGSTNSEEFQQIVNYEVNRITNEIVRSPYAIMDLTINVGIEPPEADNPDSLTQSMKDSVQQLLTNMVAAALANNGLSYTDEEIAKKVLVVAQPFRGKTDFQYDNATVSNAWLYALGGVLAALLAVGGIVVIRRRKKSEIVEEELSSMRQMDEIATDLELVTNESQVRKQLDSLANKKPEEFVNLLRTWLADE